MLPRGITGFGDAQAPDIQDVKSFTALAHTTARELGGAVCYIDTDTLSRSFYSARIESSHGGVYILMNAHYPYAAFADSVEYGEIGFVDVPGGVVCPDVRVLTRDELLQPWSGEEGELGDTEMKQIRYWKPRTVGEVVFNFWD